MKLIEKNRIECDGNFTFSILWSASNSECGLHSKDSVQELEKMFSTKSNSIRCIMDPIRTDGRNKSNQLKLKCYFWNDK